jgi:cation:H+ antiporter
VAYSSCYQAAELVAAVISVHDGHSEIVSGNVLGANAANLLLILGAVVSRCPVGACCSASST